ncbi:MAG: zinc ribbon domain-containing protein [Actinobacteria bacterium]|nr:zinc ribbon domain-containing protein [Actinomycetota bacterium]MBE3122637.1 zinc ribbon domain-containing protein [Thermoplasmata archaeon]
MNDYEELKRNGKVIIQGTATVSKVTFNISKYELKDDEEVLIATITAVGDNALITNKRILIRKTPRTIITGKPPRNYTTEGFQNFDIYYPDIDINSLCNQQGHVKRAPNEIHTRFLVKFKEEQKEYFRKHPDQILKKAGDITNPPEYPSGERWNIEEPVPFYFYTKPGFPLLETIRNLVRKTSPEYLKICARCNAKNDQNNIFCGECGTKFDETTVNKYCPECGLVNKSKNKFCDKCGTKLGG